MSLEKKTGVLRPLSGRVIPGAKQTANTIVKHSRHHGGKAVRATKQSAKRVHHHVARRPHEYFMVRWAWYDRWHGWQYHGHIHFTTLGVYLLGVFLMLLFSYQVTFASDLNQLWDFSDQNDYELDAGLEFSGNSVRLKAQNYTSDANTSLLLHLDEINGAAADDSSSNNNDGVVTEATFGAANLNNGLTFDGLNDYVSVADSASLSLSQQNTIEGWSKFNSSFSAGSHAQSQAIADKGDYRLYYDSETGKLTYELASNANHSLVEAGGNDVNGSWDLNGKNAASASTRIGSNLYVGTGVNVGDAEVWRFNGSTWTQIGGDGKNSSWPDQTFEYVYSIETDGTNIYAGLGTTAGDGEVWRYNGTSWSKIGGDGTGWAAGTFEIVTSMDYFGGNLYVGLGTTVGDADVWRYNGSTWTQIGGDGLNSGWAAGTYEMVGSLTNDGTNLYAGIGVTAGDGEVWRWNGTAWTKIGGDSINSGWDNTIETIRSLYWQGSTLYAGLGDTAGDADVYSWNGTAWTKIGGDALNSSWAGATYEGVYSFAHDGTNLFAGLGTSDGDGEVWRWNGSAWTKVGGDGVNSSWATAAGDIVQTMTSDGTTIYAGLNDAAGAGYMYSWNGSAWTLIGGQAVNKSWGFFNMGSVETLFAARGNLYAGTGSVAGSATVWEYDGSTWTIVGGQGVNSSWAANTYEMITSMQSFGGNLVVGLGTTANDAEVWSYNGSTWTQIGGDSLNSGWGANYEEVNALATDGTYLYAGIGNTANDAEVWRWNGSAWTKIGGDSLNSGWTTNYERVSTMSIFSGQLHIGLGVTAGDAEVWRWNGTAWTKIGGDSINSGWDNTIEQVESMITYNNKLYVGTGLTAGDADLWEWNGTIWTKVGGDDVNASWSAGTYENVRSLTVYNGDLFVGIGNTTADGELWRLSGSTWTKIGGNGLNGGWGNTIEEVEALSSYKGKLYAGTGNTANVDASIWSWGNNGYLQSSTASFNTDWRHVAATYDGATMKLYVNGVLDSSTSASVTLPDSARPVLIGTAYGGREQGKPQAYFTGKLDEVRISNTARSSFTTKPYSMTAQAVDIVAPAFTAGVSTVDTFVPSETANGGTLRYRLSDDDGATWQYWNGSAWTDSSGYGQASTAADVNANILSFPLSFEGITWQAILQGDGTQQVQLNSVTIEATSDTTDPATNASSVLAYKANGGTQISSNDWTNGSSPYFSWTAGTDTESGIAGYCLYVGQDGSADPVTTKGLLGTSPVNTGGHCQFMVSSTNLDLAISGYLATALTTSSSPYYLRIKAIDQAGNVFNTAAQFQFRFDNTPPSNPGFITAPSGFINTKTATLTWPTVGGQAPADSNSGLAGLQYRIGNTTWYGDSHTGAGDINDVLTNDGSYTTVDPPDFDNLIEGINTVYFRTWDQAGNVTTSYVTAALKINTAGAPSEPQNLIASPTTNTVNQFGFDWDVPATYVGDAGNLTYCYTVNVLPSESNCTFTSPGITSLGAGPYATQPGTNTFYVVAKDESENINYASYASTTFTANTPAPGIPTNMDIVDVSIKSTNNWRLALTWEPPSYVGAGIANYKVYRSTNNVTFNLVGSSSSTTYIDAGLSQQTYYYRVRACDSTNNCGADSSVVSMLPTGKFTTPATLTSEPSVSGITTKKAVIKWTTDRGSDSKVAIGTSSGQYSPSEVGNSSQVTAHTIDLDNLAAGTTYYFRAKWTDEDGNTGTSQEYAFTTAPAPSLKEVSATKVGLASATLQFTSKEASKVNVYYGQSESFGGVKSVNTSITESTYNVDLDGLVDGTKYFYRLSSFDSEGNEYMGDISSFTTPPRPRISNLRFQPVVGEPTSTQRITWTTNVPASSTITYGKIGTTGIELSQSALTTEHELVIKGLEDDSEYFIVAQSRDKDGNLSTSDRQQFHTALDTRPPRIFEVVVESSIRGTGAEARGQVVVSWKTDEPSTSQVAYAEGSNATVFNNRTAEDTELSTEHIVVVSDLPTSKVYSIQPISRDKASNAGTGVSESAIIGRPSESVLTIILNSLQRVFGF